jgi:hypothetical protein
MRLPFVIFSIFNIVVIEIQGFFTPLLSIGTVKFAPIAMTNHQDFTSPSSANNKGDDIIIEDDNVSTSLEEIYNRIKQDGKSIPQVSTSTFLLTLGVGIPIWISILLPMTMVYQLGKSVVDLPNKRRNKIMIDDTAPTSKSDSYKIPDDFTPIKDRKYDLVLFGATGFTGKLAAIYLCQQYGGRV